MEGTLRINIGDIASIDDQRFRIIYISPEWVILCQMDIEKLVLINRDFSVFKKDIEDGIVFLAKDEDTRIVDYDALTDFQKERFDSHKNFVKAVSDACGPTYMKLMELRKRKEWFTNAYLKSGLSKTQAWAIIRKYLQSGLKEYSLLNQQRLLAKEVTGQNKRGPKGIAGISSGCAFSEKVREAYESGLAYYSSGRAKSYRAAFNKINAEFFSKEVFDGKGYARDLLPMDQRPTYHQFYYYCSKRLTEEKIDEIKTSRMEQRNNKRLLLGEDSNRVEAPGEKVECDAVEFDVSLVSMVDSKQTIGRPVVYAMRDSLTHAIVAISVALDNNSNVGLTNLMLNLGDDKVEYCKKFGITLPDERLWPSNFIPMELVADRGSDFKSDEFGKICERLGITRHLVSGGSGSLKGLIESWFHQIHSMVNPHTENKGLIEKRYDSNHHKEAVMTIDDFTKNVITCVVSNNQKHMDNYMPRVAEIQNGVDSTPAYLWEFYCKKCGSPRPIADRNDYFFKLLTDKEGKLTRRGIKVNGLTYMNFEDRDLRKKMYHQQDKKSPMTVYFDPRDNSRIFYKDSENQLAVARLNTSLEWQKDLDGWTLEDTKQYFHEKAIADKKAVHRNDQIGAYQFEAIESVVNEAEKRNGSNKASTKTEHIRKARKEEQQLVRRTNAITDRLDPPNDDMDADMALPAAQALPGEQAASGIEENKTLSLEDYNDIAAHFDEYFDT